jgi:hypothetical protein
MSLYSGQMIVDADMTRQGWEIVLRFDAESAEAGWAATNENVYLDDDALRVMAPHIGTTIIEALIADRKQQEVTPGYRESLRTFRDLLEQENLDEGLSNEYVRGGVNLLADLFGKVGMPVDERMDEILDELRNMKVN